MRANLFLCEKAETTPRGFNVHRGGLTDVETHPGMPPDTTFDLLMYVAADDPSEAGPHSLELVGVDADGRELVRRTVSFNLPVGPYPRSTWVVNIPVMNLRGRYSFAMEVDGKRLADYGFGVHRRGEPFA